MPAAPLPHAVVAVLEEMHAAVALEALEAVGVEAEAVPSRTFAQLDYFRAHRLPLVELRVAAADLSRARSVLVVLAEEAGLAAIAEAGQRSGSGASSGVGVEEGAREGASGAAKGQRRTRWVAAAALATLAIGTPVLTRSRGVGERLRRVLEPRDALHGRVTGPRSSESVQRELEHAGLR